MRLIVAVSLSHFSADLLGSWTCSKAACVVVSWCHLSASRLALCILGCSPPTQRGWLSSASDRSNKQISPRQSGCPSLHHFEASGKRSAQTGKINLTKWCFLNVIFSSFAGCCEMFPPGSTWYFLRCLVVGWLADWMVMWARRCTGGPWWKSLRLAFGGSSAEYSQMQPFKRRAEERAERATSSHLSALKRAATGCSCKHFAAEHSWDTHSKRG